MSLMWRKLTSGAISVPTPQGAAWTPALDFVSANRLYRITAAGNWKPDGAPKECTADGMEVSNAGKPVCKDAPWGALIAKIGGGTADATGEIHALGRQGVLQLLDAQKAGPLYLGVNDEFGKMSGLSGSLKVEIEIAL